MAEKTLAAEHLKLFEVPKVRDGKVVTEKKGADLVPVMRPLVAKEVFHFAESDTEVVVVTTGGQKLRATKPARAKAGA